MQNPRCREPGTCLEVTVAASRKDKPNAKCGRPERSKETRQRPQGSERGLRDAVAGVLEEP